MHTKISVETHTHTGFRTNTVVKRYAYKEKHFKETHVNLFTWSQANKDMHTLTRVKRLYKEDYNDIRAKKLQRHDMEKAYTDITTEKSIQRQDYKAKRA